MNRGVKRKLSFFPFYQIDEESWSSLRSRKLPECWPDLEKHIQSSIASDEIELLQLISLDSAMRLIDSRIIAVGTVDHLLAKIRYVAEQALMLDAHSIVLAHNHTSGVVMPSWDDVTYTRALHHGFHLLRISLIDHLIVSANALFSMRRNCLIF